MGAEPYYYFTSFNPDLDAALEQLRDREFEAGRYNPAMRRIGFPIDLARPSPGAKHASIDEAREAAQEEGTRSILDIDRIGDEPDFSVAAPLDDAVLQDLYGTTHPTRKTIESNMDFFEAIERGHAIYIIVYKHGKPDELFFAGYSYD